MVFFSSLVLVYAAQQRQEDDSIFECVHIARPLSRAKIDSIRGDLRRALQVAHVLQDRWGHLASLLRVVQALVDNYEDNVPRAEVRMSHGQ
jgi:hypothetical protein